MVTYTMMHHKKSKTLDKNLQHNTWVTHANNFNHKKISLLKHKLHIYNNHEFAAQYNDLRNKNKHENNVI